MAAKSKNTLDVFKWIFDMIDTCQTADQLVSCNNLIHLYFKQYQELKIFHALIAKIDIRLKQFK
jgi:hypothetical protein